MQFVVDAQLPPALARWLESEGIPSVHVADLRLENASDIMIRRWAAEHSAVIVSKDDDFYLWRSQSNDHHPAVVWVRFGNCRKQELIRRFAELLPAIIRALNSGEKLVELR
jgi:predicted nuclease of predicted toxin-antitoxin system